MFSINVANDTVQISVFVLFVLGALVGLLGSFFGMGGGWIATPALNVFGMPMPYAVGTDLMYISGMSTVSAWKHRKMGKAEPKLALVIGCAMIVGVKAGQMAMTLLDSIGKADSVIRTVYIVMLFGLGAFMLVDALRDPRLRKPVDDKDLPPHRDAPLQKLRLAPMLYLPGSQIHISVWPLLVTGLIAGFLSGLMGVGGGFILVPIIVYVIGVRMIGAVGTSLMCLVLASPFGVLVYAVEGKVAFLAAFVMIAGALLGSPLGVRASCAVKGPRIRLLYSILVIIGGVCVLLKQLSGQLGKPDLDAVSRVLILSAAGAMSALVLLLMVLAETKQKKAAESPPA